MQNQNPRPDTESVRLLRTAGWLWLAYLAAMLLIDQAMYQDPSSILAYYLINGCAALVFLGMAYWGGLRKLLGRAYLPLMLAFIAVLPLVINHLILFLARGPMSNPEGMALRQMPILFVALAITAWQYGWKWVIVFSLGTAGLELFSVDILAPLVRFLSLPPTAPPEGFNPVPFRSIDVFLFLALVRTVSFITVGAFISQLVNRLQAQQRSLSEANDRLTHYASTLESLTVSRERNRMAHELHDTLAHSLSAISVELETVRAYWKRNPRKAHEQLDKSLAATRSGLEETRRALKSLRAGALEELGLGLALRQLAESAAARSGLDLELALPSLPPSLSPDIEQCIYRVAQEALENVVVHAQAKHLTLGLTHAGRDLALVVRDDGAGFDPARPDEADHFGLLGMRERARLAGGELSVDSRPNQGTTVTLFLRNAL